MNSERTSSYPKLVTFPPMKTLRKSRLTAEMPAESPYFNKQSVKNKSTTGGIWWMRHGFHRCSLIFHIANFRQSRFHMGFTWVSHMGFTWVSAMSVPAHWIPLPTFGPRCHLPFQPGPELPLQDALVAEVGRVQFDGEELLRPGTPLVSKRSRWGGF